MSHFFETEYCDKYSMGNPDPEHDLDSGKARLPNSYRSTVLDLIPDYFKTIKMQKPLVLDLAMGSGDSSQYLEKKGLKVIKADLSMSALGVNKGERVRCFADELPFEKNSFWAIHFKDALVHIENKEKLFKECGRVIKCGGILILTTDLISGNFFSYIHKNGELNKMSTEFFEDFDDYLKKMAYIKKKYKTDLFGPPYFSTGKEEINNTLLDNGFKIIRSFDWRAKIGENDWYKFGHSRKVFVAIKE